MILKVENLAKEYPKFKLNNISFSINEGEIMGLIGRNGAGKSTTLKAILNMIYISNGTIEMFDKNYKQNELYCKSNIGVVFGGIDYYELKKVSTITSITKKFYKNWDEKLYRTYLETFNIDSSKRIKELSAGMKVKYQIAVALSHNAKLLILDEPTSGLDPVSREELLTLFMYLAQTKKISILFSTHITSDLEKCANTITYIKDGNLIASMEKTKFIKHFQYLKTSPTEPDLSLEEIMIKNERCSYDF